MSVSIKLLLSCSALHIIFWNRTSHHSDFWLVHLITFGSDLILIGTSDTFVSDLIGCPGIDWLRFALTHWDWLLKNRFDWLLIWWSSSTVSTLICDLWRFCDLPCMIFANLLAWLIKSNWYDLMISGHIDLKWCQKDQRD